MRAGLALFAGLAALAAVFAFPQSATVRETAAQALNHATTKATPAHKAKPAPDKPHPAAKKPAPAATAAKGGRANAVAARSAHGKTSSTAAGQTSFAAASSTSAAAIRQAARNFVLAEVTGNATLYCSLLTSQAQIALAQEATVSAGTPLETCEAVAGDLLSTTAQPDTLTRYYALIADAPIALHGSTALMQIGSQSAELQDVDGEWLFIEVL